MIELELGFKGRHSKFVERVEEFVTAGAKSILVEYILDKRRVKK